MQSPDNPVARVDHNVPPRWSQTDVNDDVVGDPEGIPNLVCLGIDNVQPAFVGSSYDVITGGCEEGHGGCLLGILCCLLFRGIVALELGSAGGRGEGMLHRDLFRYVYNDGLVFEEGSYE